MDQDHLQIVFMYVLIDGVFIKLVFHWSIFTFQDLTSANFLRNTRHPDDETSKLSRLAFFRVEKNGIVLPDNFTDTLTICKNYTVYVMT